MDESKSKFKYCSIFQTAEGSTAVKEAIKLRDTQSVKEILELERECHPENSRDGIRCFRDVTRTDGQSTEIAEMLDQMYDKTFAGRYIAPIFIILPLLLRLASIIYDEVTDVLLAIEYHGLSSSAIQKRFYNDFNHSCFSETPRPSFRYNVSGINSCQQEMPVHADEYQFAKWYIIFSVLVMLLLNGILLRSKLKKCLKIQIGKDNIFSTAIDGIFLIFGSIFSPLLIIWELINLINLKRKIAVEEKEVKKLELLDKFWNHQLKFGMFEAIEATEASAQLLLQIWLAATKFECYYGEGFWPIFRRAFTGIFFVFMESTSTEDKTLGKILISFISIVISAFSMYRRTKREAVNTLRSPSLMVSILSQIFVHIICLLPLYFAERHPLGLLLPIAIHYILIFVLKFFFDPSFHLAIGSNKIIALLNVVGSVIINVNLTPLDGYIKHKQKVRSGVQFYDDLNNEDVERRMLYDLEPIETTEDDTGLNAVHHTPSTFFLQALFLLIKVVENIVVYQVVIHSCQIWKGIELFENLELNIGHIILGGTLLTWISHSIYYRFFGHPWSYSNGPSVGKWFLRYQIHFMGKTLRIGENNKPET